jgi:hypothetical protein
MPKIDWLKVVVWGGLTAFALTIWGLALIGAAWLLGLLP